MQKRPRKDQIPSSERVVTTAETTKRINKILKKAPSLNCLSRWQIMAQLNKWKNQSPRSSSSAMLVMMMKKRKVRIEPRLTPE